MGFGGTFAMSLDHSLHVFFGLFRKLGQVGLSQGILLRLGSLEEGQLSGREGTAAASASMVWMEVGDRRVETTLWKARSRGRRDSILRICKIFNGDLAFNNKRQELGRIRLWGLAGRRGESELLEVGNNVDFRDSEVSTIYWSWDLVVGARSELLAGSQ